MRDFSAIAPHIGGSLRQLDSLLPQHGFFQSEGLSPSLHGGYSSEIWLRREGNEFFAVRIDWLGHASHATQPHYHLVSFPATQRFAFEHRGAGRVDVTKYDPRTGLPTTVDPHEPLLRDDR
jgi:hypothetical protein